MDAYEEYREAMAVGENENRADEEPQRPAFCPACGHELELHNDPYGCDYEADRYEADFGPVAWRCGCTAQECFAALLEDAWYTLNERKEKNLCG